MISSGAHGSLLFSTSVRPIPTYAIMNTMLPLHGSVSLSVATRSPLSWKNEPFRKVAERLTGKA
ncbi:hypothetical protein CMEL01_06266 [Colletotrichum melonis]|uniref:Uncharacterized protein n=1 Tax=Colletotrichum melonis TaxID=1209925 RepID=A0AAI9U4S0_9PEZI|nr:hypothetical protein CMEL01_06266 [Colletotrichum melonis]